MDRAFPFELRPDRLGGGAGGAVWRAVHRTSGAEVAVKLLHGVEGQRSWQAEAQLIGRLDHPNVVRLLDFGTLPGPLPVPREAPAPAGTGWLATAYVDGGTLDDWLGDPAVEWWDVREVLGELASALAHAHARAVLHRDLKPANVLLTRAPAVGQGVRLADFGGGLARGTGGSRAAGTRRYRSPEVARVGPSRLEGPWSDLFSLGALAWALVTGAPPADVADAAWDGPGPLQPRFAVPDGLEELLLALLAGEPAERPPYAADVLRALDALGPPVAPSTAPAAGPAPPPPGSEPTFELRGEEPEEAPAPAPGPGGGVVAGPAPGGAPGSATELAPAPTGEEDPGGRAPEEAGSPTRGGVVEPRAKRSVPGASDDRAARADAGARPPSWERRQAGPFPLRDLPHDAPPDPERAADAVAVRSLRLRPAPTTPWAPARARLAAALSRAAAGGAVVHQLRAGDPDVRRRLLAWFEAWAAESGVRVLRLEVGPDGQRAPLLDALEEALPGAPARGPARGGEVLLDPAEVADSLRRLAAWRPLALLVPDVDLAPGLAELLTKAWPLGARPAARVLVVETAAPAAPTAPWGAAAVSVEEEQVPERGPLDFADALRSVLRVRGPLLDALRGHAGGDVERALALLDHWLGLGWARSTTRGVTPGEGPAPLPPWAVGGSPGEALAAAVGAARGVERAAWLVAAALAPRLDERDWEEALAASPDTRGDLPAAREAVAAVRDRLRALAVVEPVPGGWRLDPRGVEGLTRAVRDEVALAHAHACAAAAVRGHPEGPDKERRLARHLLAAGQLAAAAPHVVAATRTQARAGSAEAAARVLDEWEAAADRERLSTMAKERALVALARAELLLLLGRRPEAEALLSPVVERHGRSDDPLLRARLFRFRGMARRAQRERWPAAIDDLVEAAEAAEEAERGGLPGAAEERARTALHRATTARLLLRRREAEEAVLDARRRFDALGDEHGLGDALTEHANWAGKLAGDWALAERLAEAARAHYERAGWRRGVLVSELSRAGALLELGHLAEAAEVYTFLADRFEEDGHRGLQACRVNLAVISLRRGRPEAAAAQLALVDASAAGPASGGWLAVEVELGLAACAEDEGTWTRRLLGAMRLLRGGKLDETQAELRTAARTRAVQRGFVPSLDEVAAFVGLPPGGPRRGDGDGGASP